MMLVDKYANHRPFKRQSEQYAHVGIELSVSTLADHVGACAATLRPLFELIKAHIFAAERVHGDDTDVPVPSKGKTRTGRIWTYVAMIVPPAARQRWPPCSSTRRIGRADRSRKPAPERMRGASCSSLPTSPRRRVRASRPRSHRLISRRRTSSTPASRWSARSTAARPKRRQGSCLHANSTTSPAMIPAVIAGAPTNG
ncbi:transposase [Mesorhizobium sp. VK23B]|uniref:Transposase n=1 Tax=Mesorhizobium dulcispinae TaxID=3072316 RepID=A0ABU4XMW1_9HYPH|nr:MULTISPECIES: transposase [unclassified Mesorhizobium]MDX8469735.1 transposase [Mesorhizobium sp. VK23B]MDX8476074.1 transposase [Mesorhizobium sp. VK23A]